MMLDPFLIAFREALQASVLLAIVLFSAPARHDASARRSLLSGFFAALALGIAAGSVLPLTRALGTHESWTFWRHVGEAVLFYSSIVLLIRKLSPPPAVVNVGMFLFGSLLVLFEARTLGFIVHDMGVSAGRTPEAFWSAAGGLLLGCLPLLLLRGRIRRLPFERAFPPANLLMFTAALQFWFGGLSELGGESIMAPLQNGLRLFVNEFMKSVQSALLISGHPFLDVTFSGLAEYLGSDRSALTLTVLFLMTPPLIILAAVFGRPDPAVSHIAAASQRRQDVAAFRQDLVLQSAPPLLAFLILVVLLHAMNLSLNPLYDPAPFPVREAEGSDVLRIPITGSGSDLSDKKLRKYIYVEGSRQILFLAIQKPDGTVGVALDQCEICRPADWNKDARGYAQQGENLFCKYCVTPITAHSVNTPGGCNPIPVPHTIRENAIIISIRELVSLFDKAEALERKGTHL